QRRKDRRDKRGSRRFAAGRKCTAGESVGRKTRRIFLDRRRPPTARERNWLSTSDRGAIAASAAAKRFAVLFGRLRIGHITDRGSNFYCRIRRPWKRCENHPGGAAFADSCQ